MFWYILYNYPVVKQLILNELIGVFFIIIFEC